jgi:galactokinase
MKIEQISGTETKPHEIIEFESMLRYEDFQVFGELGFEKSGQVLLTRAPARLDVMGGIADYCGANVFEMPLEHAAVAGCQARSDQQLRALSVGTEGASLPGVQVSLDDFYANGSLKSYTQVRQLFTKNSQTAWAGYVLGSFYVLLKEKKIEHLPHGATVVIKSNIPMGLGISSSAAIEVAALTAINHLYELNLDALEIARLGQIVENRIVGAPCGIMDQITSATGQKGEILSILCQPDQILETVPLPPHTRLIGINSKAKRSTSSSAYIDARTAAFMGLTILQKELELDELADNYLCRLSVADFRQKCWRLLPKRMKGQDFLDRYGQTVDTVTEVEPEKTYPVRSRVEHPIYEHDRVQRFIEHIKAANADLKNIRKHLVKAGRLMYASNWSYRFRVGLGSPEVEQLVRSARKIGVHNGLYGAKITGGGGGGTVALLCHGDISSALIQMTAAYKLAWGLEAEVFRGSSPGAFEFGHIVLKLTKEQVKTDAIGRTTIQPDSEAADSPIQIQGEDK